MKSSILYRLASALLIMFAAGHTLGFHQVEPDWHVDALATSMKSVHFDMLGTQRSFWDLFLALGYSLGLFYLFSAILAWQLAALPTETLARLRVTLWAFALTYLAVLAVSCLWLFAIPIAFAGAVTLCLTAAAWRAGK